MSLFLSYSIRAVPRKVHPRLRHCTALEWRFFVLLRHSLTACRWLLPSPFSFHVFFKRQPPLLFFGLDVWLAGSNIRHSWMMYHIPYLVCFSCLFWRARRVIFLLGWRNGGRKAGRGCTYNIPPTFAFWTLLLSCYSRA